MFWGEVYNKSCTRSAIKGLSEYSACYVSGTVQIQLNNLLILISKSSFATELHPIPPRVLFPPPSRHKAPLPFISRLIQHVAIRRKKTKIVSLKPVADNSRDIITADTSPLISGPAAHATDCQHPSVMHSRYCVCSCASAVLEHIRASGHGFLWSGRRVTVIHMAKTWQRSE